MNKVILIGNLTKDPEVRYTQSNEPMAVARYSIAVTRKGRDAGTDFISCVAFGKNGEFAEKFLHKGMKIAVVGRIQTGSYEKDGHKIYTTDVVVEEHEFVEKKGETTETVPTRTDEDGFAYVPDDGFDELPFGQIGR